MPDGEVGELVLRHASIGLTKSRWKAYQRYAESYWSTIHGIQLRSEAAAQQVEGARNAVGENGGGLQGVEEAAACATILGR